MKLLFAMAALLLALAQAPARACDVSLLALTIGDAQTGLEAAIDAPTFSLGASHAREVSEALGQAAMFAASCACTRAAVSLAKASTGARVAHGARDSDGFDRRMDNVVSDFDQAMSEIRSCRPRLDEDAPAAARKEPAAFAR